MPPTSPTDGAWRVKQSEFGCIDDLRGLSDIDLDSRQIKSPDDIPIYFSLYCSHPKIQLGSRIYGLGIDHALIRWRLENAEIIDRYEGLRIQQGSFSLKVKSQLEVSSDASAKAGADLSGTASPAKAAGKASGMFGLDVGISKRNRRMEDGSEAKDVYIISHAGKEAFAIGDVKYGDPRRNQNLLYHSYKCVQVNEKTKLEDELPIFRLKAQDGNQPVFVHFFACIPTDRLYLLTSRASKPISANKKADERLFSLAEALRTQMLEQEISERLQRNQRGLSIPKLPGEIVVFAQSISVSFEERSEDG